jgi:hypothetical protein
MTEIPSDIREQEAEIESMFRELVQSGDCAGSHDAQYWPESTPQRELFAWILVVALGFVGTAGLYLLRHWARGN